MKSLICRKSALVLLVLFSGFFAETANAQSYQAVLVRGNHWQPGIPGFGSNMLSALFGEYALENVNTASRINPDNTVARVGSFSVRASREPLHFDERLWKPWPGIANAMQYGEDGSLLIGFYFDSSGSAGSWVIVFQFPQGFSGMDDALINRLIRSWIGRFGYFLSLAKGFSDVSLPATFVF